MNTLGYTFRTLAILSELLRRHPPKNLVLKALTFIGVSIGVILTLQTVGYAEQYTLNTLMIFLFILLICFAFVLHQIHRSGVLEAAKKAIENHEEPGGDRLKSRKDTESGAVGRKYSSNWGDVQDDLNETFKLHKTELMRDGIYIILYTGVSLLCVLLALLFQPTLLTLDGIISEYIHMWSSTTILYAILYFSVMMAVITFLHFVFILRMTLSIYVLQGTEDYRADYAISGYSRRIRDRYEDKLED